MDEIEARIEKMNICLYIMHIAYLLMLDDICKSKFHISLFLQLLLFNIHHGDGYLEEQSFP